MPTFNALNMPIHRASTLVYDNARDFLNRSERLLEGFSYGLYGTPTVRALEEQVATVEGGKYTMLVPSGLASVTHPLLALLRSGDHVLVADCVYGPTRDLFSTILAQYGITHSFFPSDAHSIEPWLNDQTRLVVLESPGSYTMEIQEIATIAEQAHAQGALVMMDNTWGFGRIDAFAHGVDIAASALSKYAGGHSDVCMGACTVVDRELFLKLRTAMIALGTGVSSDDAYLVLRGLQTLDVRLDQHAERAHHLAAWLNEHPAVSRVFYPALESDAQFPRFKRYFRGGNGVISLTLEEQQLPHIERFIDSLQRFQIGASWGGTHSLVALTNMTHARSAKKWEGSPWLLRLHVGLEPLEELKGDLENALAALL